MVSALVLLVLSGVVVAGAEVAVVLILTLTSSTILMLIAIRSIATIETAAGSTILIIVVAHLTEIIKAVRSMEINVAVLINVRIIEAVMPNVTRHAQPWINVPLTLQPAVSNYKVREETEHAHRSTKPIARYLREG